MLPTDQDLDLVPIEDLLKALNRRYDAWVFVAGRNRGDGRDNLRCNFDGPTLVQLGLLAHATAMITKLQLDRLYLDPENTHGG